MRSVKPSMVDGRLCADRHRRLTQCGQEHDVQPAHKAVHPSGELSVLHHRAQSRTRSIMPLITAQPSAQQCQACVRRAGVMESAVLSTFVTFTAQVGVCVGACECARRSIPVAGRPVQAEELRASVFRGRRHRGARQVRVPLELHRSALTIFEKAGSAGAAELPDALCLTRPCLRPSAPQLLSRALAV